MKNMVINFLVFLRLVYLVSAGIQAVADNYEGAFWSFLFSVVSGAIVSLLTPRANDKCPDCGGSGFMVKIDNRKVSCSYCDGTGICA